jgi:hypothetical protein
MSFSRFVVNKLAFTAEVSAIAGGHNDGLLRFSECKCMAILRFMYAFIVIVCTAACVHGIVLVMSSFSCFHAVLSLHCLYKWPDNVGFIP